MSAAADVDSLSLKELKNLISSAGLSFADCIDKNDLRTRAKEAQTRLASAPPAPSPSTGSSKPDEVQRRMAGYDCIVKGPPDLLEGRPGAAPADMLVLVLHGLGATNTDLVTVLPVFKSAEPSLASARILEVYPQAPQVPMLGTAWWKFNVMSYMQAGNLPSPDLDLNPDPDPNIEPSGLTPTFDPTPGRHDEGRHPDGQHHQAAPGGHRAVP